jgi:(p)ppGpp synthase/HD superfamily hydrolase
MSALTFRAYEYALVAHMGQKYGDEPYVHHPVRVANRLDQDDEIGIAVAFLHDVVEDTKYTLDDLRLAFRDEIVQAVDAITKRKGEKYFDYIRRLSSNPIAKRVKIADLQENLSQGDLSLSTRYYKALKMLED